MTSKDVRKARQSHGRNALNPALPMSAALQALGSHLRDARRAPSSRRPQNRAAQAITKGK
ncbi:hypothetical protein [Paraburkholderia rhynchosiae]|uniref:Uncharacterized protein n=1 Tax=Paraburkholderia rhynchosiae TaxID=487049 RepID=A0A2N7WD02_9BURK|nr:hypothetical protein [Paraburkholderia rhynchosiae]PMS27300.1 hypothetical protein C0Z16_25070 [Paraburkholderia rhynchosiae]CAB3744258.1 hypothetical protein LMG27174_07142 [Paraburkholderia rhynchosiae]